MQVRYRWIAMVPDRFTIHGAARALQSRMVVSRVAGEPNGVTAP